MQRQSCNPCASSSRPGNAWQHCVCVWTCPLRNLNQVVIAAFLSTILVPVAAAGQWAHLENVFGGTACAARLTGSQVDTMLLLNQNSQLILVAGRSDWSASGPEKVSLRIDNFQIDHLQANAFNNLVLLLISDEAVLKRLIAAKDLYWTLPSGRYHAAVSGLGNEVEWVRSV